MSRMANMSPLGLYQWDNTIFDLMLIPEALDKSTLIDNLLSETAELEVLYPNPVVLKNLIGVWSAKQIDIWNRLYATTQYEYNPIENYDRYETGSEDGEGWTTHSGTDTTADSTTFGGTDARAVAIARQHAEGGTESEQSTSQFAQGGSDATTVGNTRGHFVAGFDSAPSSTDDGLVKQTRDQEDGTSTTTYGKTESGNGSNTTNFGKTLSETENTSENKTYGQTIQKAGNMTHGEQIATTSEGSHELHAHGNIGTMTVQDMIRQQRQIELFNLYDIIIEDFKMRFCILVY